MMKPNTTAPAKARAETVGPNGSFPVGDAEHARLAIGGATRSEHAGNITRAEEATIKAKARAKLGAYKIGPTRGPIPELRKAAAEHPDAPPHVKRLIIATLGNMSANGLTHGEMEAHGTASGEHHVTVKPRADMSSMPGGKFGYPPQKAPPMRPDTDKDGM